MRMKKVILLLLTFGVAGLFAVYSLMGKNWQEHYDLSVKYLDDSKYALAHVEALEAKKCIEDDYQKFLTLELLAVIDKYLGNMGQSLKYCEQAVELGETIYGDHGLRLSNTLIALGGAYLALEKYKKSKETFERALSILELAWGEGEIETADCLFFIAEASGHLGDLGLAEDNYRKYLDILNEHRLRATHRYAIGCYRLAYVLMERGKYPESELQFKTAVKVWRYESGLNSNNLLNGLEGLSSFYYQCKQHKEVLPIREEIVSIEESHFGKHDVKLIESLYRLSFAESNVKKHAEAEKTLFRIMEIVKGEGQKEMLDRCYKELSLLYIDMEKPKEAEKYKSLMENE